MKYCPKCIARRLEAHKCCYECGVILVSDPKNNDEKLAMIKIIIKEALLFIAECATNKKQHESKIEAIVDCPACRQTTISKFAEIIVLVEYNGKAS